MSITSLASNFDQHINIQRRSCERDFSSIWIGWYLQELTLGVHEMDYLVGFLSEGLDMVPNYHDFLLIDHMQRDFGNYTWQGSGWSKGRFMLDRKAWDPSIEGFLHERIVQTLGMILWQIQDRSIFSSDSDDQQPESVLVQALLEEKQFFVESTMISPIWIFLFNMIK